MKKWIKKYQHAWVFLYGLIYLPWFYYLEKTVVCNFSVIEIPLDLKIPFIEHFIVFYGFWFFYVAIAVLYFFFTNKKDFYKLVSFLVIGMTAFLVISTLFPNGQLLRPRVFPRDNMFVDMVKQLYAMDTPTNIFPSIHVYNSLAVMIAVSNSKKLKNKYYLQIITFFIGIMIILSTMFLKQHSVVDVLGALACGAISYAIVYVDQPKKVSSLSKQPI